MHSMTSIMGPSGCGKSTLQSRLGLLLALDNTRYSRVDEFEIQERRPVTGMLLRHNVAQLLHEGTRSQSKIEELRRRLMGFYIQGGELIPTLTITENVAMPLRLNGVPAREATERAEELLAYLLSVPTKEIPHKLALDSSGGEYQRVALARAIAHEPKILFVDEPTSNLDPPNKRRVLDLMCKLVRHEETTVVMISHDEALARSYSDYLIKMDADADGWGDRVPIAFRELDGFGHPVSFEAKIDGRWQHTDSSFQLERASMKEEQHVN